MSVTVSLLILGGDLHTGVVSRSPLGARTKPGPTLRNFLEMDERAARRMVADLPGGRLLLTVPAAWCATRPVQVAPEQWRSAREEILAQVDRLLPIPPEEAMLGLVGLADESGEPRGGTLVGVRRSQVEPWRRAIEGAFGRPIDAVLTPHMALLGFGLQHDRRAVVIERLARGLDAAHTLAWGRPVSIGESADEAPVGEARTLALPSSGEGASDADYPGAETLSPQDALTGAALAESVAPGRFAPVDGRPPRATPPWLAPGAAALLALVFVLAAGPIRDARLERAANEAEQAARALEDDLVSVQTTRRRAERVVRLLEEGVGAATTGWSSPLPALREATQALGEQGFLRRVEVTPQRLRIRGEAAQAGELLERLESSPLLSGAAMEAPLARSGDTGLDIFEIRADRAGASEERP